MIRIEVLEVRGKCALNYKPGDGLVIEEFYIASNHKPICIHAFFGDANPIITIP